MKINILHLNPVNKANKINFVSNPILKMNFKGIEADTFDSKKTYTEREQAEIIKKIDDETKGLKSKSSDTSETVIKNQQLRMLRERRIAKWIAKFNPNSAFFADENLTTNDKREILKKHPEIVHFSINSSDFQRDSYIKLIRDSRYFISNKLGNYNYLDTSWSINKSNYERISRDGVISNVRLKKDYGFKEVELRRYLREGYLESIKLKNHYTGKEEAVQMFDMNNATNISGIERHKNIMNKVKTISVKNGQLIPINYLTKLGFGNKKDIIELFQYKYKEGIVERKSPENDEKTTYIKYNDGITKDLLLYLKNNNKNIIDTKGLIKHIEGCTISDIEDALLQGEIECIPYSFDFEDENNILFNLKNKKNTDFINKKNFEYELAKDRSGETRQINNALISYVTVQLCPKTKDAFQSMLAQNPKISKIFEKIDEMKKCEKESKVKESEEKGQRLSVTKEERETLRNFYKKLWDTVGTDEYKEALSRSIKAFKECKTCGLWAVSDDEVKGIIGDYLR